MAQDTVYALILTKGGKVMKTYESAKIAKEELKQMLAEGMAIHAYVFGNFLFKVMNTTKVIISKEFE